jgi:uncharacterized paraquat-inducible protein A
MMGQVNHTFTTIRCPRCNINVTRTFVVYHDRHYCKGCYGIIKNEEENKPKRPYAFYLPTGRSG